MDETLIKKIMPHSMEAEQAVIGSMLMDRDAMESAWRFCSRMISMAGNTVRCSRQYVS